MYYNNYYNETGRCHYNYAIKVLMLDIEHVYM